MKILQIVSSSRISGAEKHVVVLSERLKQRGHEITALCPPGGWLPDQLRAASVPVIEMPMHGVKGGPTALHLAKMVREQNFELIHAHLTCATYFGYLIGKWTKRPVAASVHVQSRDFVYRHLFPRRDNHIITVSDWVRDGFLRQGVPARQIHTIYNGTEFCAADGKGTAETNPFLSLPDASHKTPILPVRAELSLPPEAELIGIFARVEEFKGHPILVQAMKQIVRARPRAYVVCVGPVEPVIQKALWETAAADGTAERIRFTGVRNDVQRLMSEMEVITLPSRYEACSMAIIEAMAMGKPVIATRAGGNPELVQDEKTGLLIERTPEALAQAIIAVLADAERRHRMGAAAQQRAHALFSADVMVDHVEALYCQMVQAKANFGPRPTFSPR